jgi:hypothetical protein
MKIPMEQRRADLERMAWTAGRDSIVAAYMNRPGIRPGTRPPAGMPPSAMIYAIITHEYKDQTSCCS